MGTKPIMPLLLSMSVPPMVSMLIQSLYNVVDSIFVARLSENALTAVSLAFPLQNLVLAVAVGLGVGLNACIARSLGADDSETANSAATHGMILTAIHSLMFVLVGIFATKPFLRMFTDNDEIFDMACRYSYIVICLAFGSLFHIFIEKIFQATGNMVVPMVLQGIGAIINIVMDPLLIFGLYGFPQLGVTGAAIATILGQFSTCALAIIFFVKSKTPVKISLKDFHFSGKMVKQLYAIAIPSGIIIALPSVLVGILNALLGTFSQTAVAVFGVYFKLQTFVYMPVAGVVQGMRPLMSYNYGAGKLKRMDQALYASLLVSGIILVIGWILFSVFPVPIMKMFDAQDEMLQLGTSALRTISFGFAVSTFGVVLAGAFESLGKGVESLLISMIRQFLVIPPVAWILSHVWGVTGVWASFPAAETLAAVFAIVLYSKTRKKIVQ